MHKKLNIFEYEIDDDNKIELTIIQISNLLDGILNDYEYLKYNIDFKCIYDEEDYEDYEEYEDIIRNYNKGNKIVELYNTYYNKKRTKKSVYEQIGNELNIKWKSVQKTYLKNK